MRRRLFCVCGGGVVDGLFDSIDMDPRVRFVDLFGVSSADSLAAIFLSSSRCANDLTEVAAETGRGVEELDAACGFAGAVDAEEVEEEETGGTT